MKRETSLGRATVKQVCEAFHVSRQAYYQATKPLAESPKAVVADRRGPWVTNGVLVTCIRQVVAENPGWGSRKVWAVLRRDGIKASRKRVWKLMQVLGLVLPAPNHEARTRYEGHVSVPDSNRRWGTDLTTVWTRADGVVAIVPVIDFGDRYALDCVVTKSQESAPVLAATRSALVREFVRPSEVPAGLELRTDHGPQFVGRDAEALCNRWRLDHTFAPVGRPTGNAVTERFILTLKTELIWTRDWNSKEELAAAVRDWLEHYNSRRPHQALAWRTPAEQRAMNLTPQEKKAA